MFRRALAMFLAAAPVPGRERASRLCEAAAGAVAAFALNWVWENGQAPLYAGYAGFAANVWGCTLASFGDVAIVALIWAAVAAAWRDFAWHRRLTVARALVAILFGVAIAAAIEYAALASGRWAYGAMPLIPLAGIGLAPVLQMALLPVPVFAIMAAAGRGSGRRGGG